MYWILRIIIWGLGIAGALTVGYNIRDYYYHIYENIFGQIILLQKNEMSIHIRLFDFDSKF